MRQGIHPNYVLSNVSCACGYSFQTKSTKPSIHLEICSNCHPFFTGKQKLVDSAGRVERFSKRFQKTSGKTVRVKAKSRAGKNRISAPEVLSTGARKAKTSEDKKTSEKKTSASKSK